MREIKSGLYLNKNDRALIRSETTMYLTLYPGLEGLPDKRVLPPRHRRASGL